jgi:hypothetical protein
MRPFEYFRQLVTLYRQTFYELPSTLYFHRFYTLNDYILYF